MLDAGAQVVETDTFQASRLKLDEWGLAEHTHEINVKAAQIARRAAGEDRFVAGSIGPTGFLPASDDPTLGNISFRALADVFAEQARGLIEGGADLLIIETAQDILEVKAAIFGAREAFAATGKPVPIQCSVSLLPNGGKMLLGTDIDAVLTTLTALKIDVIGLNCSTGPEDMRDAIRFLGEHSPIPVHCIPNAGLPLQGPDGETIFPEQPEPLAATLGEFVERYGVNVVGGCCGTTPEHIRAIAERVKGLTPSTRPAAGPPRVSSMIAATPLAQEPRPTIVGERVNSQGSRKAKELLLADDYDGLLQIAEDQVEGGAHVLDLCVALTERQDEDEQMRILAKKVSLSLPAPIQVDSTEPEVMQAALEQIPGRAIVNSVNLEAGASKLDTVVPALPRARRRADRADDRRGVDGQDRAAQARHRQAHPRLRLRRARDGPAAADLRRAHVHARDRLGRVQDVARSRRSRASARSRRSCPACSTSLGVSNVSLRLRQSRTRGAQQRLPAPLRRGRARPRDGAPEGHHALRRDPAARARPRRRPRLQPPRRRDRSASSSTSRSKGESAEEEAADPTAGMEPEEALHFHILRRKKEGVEDWIDRRSRRSARSRP